MNKNRKFLIYFCLFAFITQMWFCLFCTMYLLQNIRQLYLYIVFFARRWVQSYYFAGEVIEHGMVKSVLEEGMPRYRNPFSKGRLIIQFVVTFPQAGWCTDESKLKQLEGLLPPKKQIKVEDHFEEVDLSPLVFWLFIKKIKGQLVIWAVYILQILKLLVV